MTDEHDTAASPRLSEFPAGRHDTEPARVAQTGQLNDHLELETFFDVDSPALGLATARSSKGDMGKRCPLPTWTVPQGSVEF
jgi:hypothetical protein